MNKANNRNPILFLYAAWVISIIATLGSLYFSEMKGFVPCEYCWYQRIFMYPFVFILGIAAFMNDFKVTKYALPLSIIGGCISLYHYLIQKVDGLAPIKPCVSGVPCDLEYINWFGFITIPFLALIAFVSITILLFIVKRKA